MYVLITLKIFASPFPTTTRIPRGSGSKLVILLAAFPEELKHIYRVNLLTEEKRREEHFPISARAEDSEVSRKVRETHTQLFSAQNNLAFSLSSHQCSKQITKGTCCCCACLVFFHCSNFTVVESNPTHIETEIQQHQVSACLAVTSPTRVAVPGTETCKPFPGSRSDTSPAEFSHKLNRVKEHYFTWQRWAESHGNGIIQSINQIQVCSSECCLVKFNLG